MSTQNKYTENKNLLYKVFCKDLQDVKQRFTIGGIAPTEIKEIKGSFNMLFLKGNQFTAVCNDGKFYLVTL
jgi:hypothetical protein